MSKDIIYREDAIKVTWQEPSYTDAINTLTEVRERIEVIPAVEPWDLYDVDEWCRDCKEYDTEHHNCPRWNRVIRRTLEENQPKQGEWIPCSERLPKDLEVVNITWINHRPMTYYADIKDKPFTATAIHYKDKWWWYSPICEDLLAEYGKSECDKMDADIEVTAWMPLPEPWKGADDE